MKNKYQMAEVNPSLLVITLNVNGLNSLINKQRLADWIFFLKRSKMLSWDLF